MQLQLESMEMNHLNNLMICEVKIEKSSKAKELEQLLLQLPYVENVEPVSTNIIIFAVQSSIDETAFITALEAKGIRIIQLGKGKLRIVTHRDYTATQHSYFMRILKELKF